MTLCSKFTLKQTYKLIDLIRFLRGKKPEIQDKEGVEIKTHDVCICALRMKICYNYTILRPNLKITNEARMRVFHQGVGIRKSVGVRRRMRNKSCIYEDQLTKTMGWSSS